MLNYIYMLLKLFINNNKKVNIVNNWNFLWFFFKNKNILI